MGDEFRDEFAGDMGVEVQVDIPSLEAEARRLAGLQEYVLCTLVPHLSQVSKAIGVNDVAFGTFAEARKVAMKHDQYLKAVAQGYTEVANELGQAVAATNRIIDSYRTVEARNEANARDIERIFDESGSGPGAGKGRGL